MLKKSILLSMTTGILLMTGCATIVSGKPKVNVKSEPDGAKVSVAGNVVCDTTPCIVDVASMDSGDTMTITKNGYKSSTQIVNKEMNGWFWANIVSWGLPGSTTDGVSGASHKASPDNIYVELKPE